MFIMYFELVSNQYFCPIFTALSTTAKYQTTTKYNLINALCDHQNEQKFPVFVVAVVVVVVVAAL